MMKVIHERDKCIGCGACVAVCSEFFEMANDGKPVLKGAEKAGETYSLNVEEGKCLKDAAEACPVKCIHLE